MSVNKACKYSRILLVHTPGELSICTYHQELFIHSKFVRAWGELKLLLTRVSFFLFV